MFLVILRCEPASLVVFCFKGIQSRRVPQGQTDIVETLDQAEFAERVKIKRCLESARIAYDLLLERNHELIARNRLCVLKKRLDLFFRKANKYDAVFARIRKEDIGKCWRDHTAEAKVAQCPCGVLATRAAAKVLSGYQNLCVVVARIVDDEGRILLARCGLAPAVECATCSSRNT